MPLSSAAKVIAETPEADATFFSLAYLTALQQCTARAYGATLRSVTSATGAAGFLGDGIGECIARTRLETERRVAAQLRRAVKREEESDSPERRANEGSDGAARVAAGRPAGAPGTSAARHRGSSAVAASANASTKASRRGSRKVSLRLGSAESAAANAVAGGSGEGRRDGAESVAPLATSSGGAEEEEEVAVAVQLLRDGLCRAMGWPTRATPPPSSASSSAASGGGAGEAPPLPHNPLGSLNVLADTLLSRHSFPPSALHTEPAASARHLYMELDDAGMQRDALLEWVEDVFLFSLHHNYSTAQTQCVLLDALLAVNTLMACGDGQAWEERLAEALQDALCTQTCPTTTRVLDVVHQRRPVTRQVPDPVQLAELELRRQKATSQKALAALEAAQSAIPLVTQTIMEEVSTEVERDATLPAHFTMAESAAIVDFITRSAVMHRGLWAVVTADVTDAALQQRLRPSHKTPLVAYVEDVPPVFVPPLSAFYPAALQDAVDAQRAVYAECEALMTAAFADDYAAPLVAVAQAEEAERLALVEAARRAAAEDKSAAMTAQECAHVERAFQLRLRDAMEHSERVGAGAGKTGGGSVSMPSAATLKSPRLSADLAATATAAAAAAAAAAPQPAAAVFSLANVEKRMGRIAAAVEEMPVAPVGGKAGQRKH